MGGFAFALRPTGGLSGVVFNDTNKNGRRDPGEPGVAGATVEHLPRFMMYNPLNAWGRQREVPAAPKSTFRQWYLKNRGKG